MARLHFATRPGFGLGALLRKDARAWDREPSRSMLDGINLHPHNVEESYEALTRTVAALQQFADPRAVFPEVYAIITRNVGLEIRSSTSVFRAPHWVSRLTGYFAERYFIALESSLHQRAPASLAWDIAFSEGRSGCTIPVLDALLGINAHINFDLAQGLYDNIVGSNAVGDPEQLDQYKHDHDAVNSILRASMPEIFDRLEIDYGCFLTQRLTQFGGRKYAMEFMLGTLQRWREEVWQDLLVLLNEERQIERERHIVHMNESSAAISRSMSVGARTRAFKQHRHVDSIRRFVSAFAAKA